MRREKGTEQKQSLIVSEPDPGPLALSPTDMMLFGNLLPPFGSPPRGAKRAVPGSLGAFVGNKEIIGTFTQRKDVGQNYEVSRLAQCAIGLKSRTLQSKGDLLVLSA